MTRNDSGRTKRWARLGSALWRLSHGERRRYGRAIGALAVASALSFATPLVIRQALDAIQSGDVSASMLWGCAAAVIGLTLFEGVFAFFKGRLTAASAEGIVRRLRERLYGHLNRLPMNWHGEQSTGDLVQRCTSDVDTLRQFLSMDVTQIGHGILLVLFAVPVLMWIDPALGCLSLVLVPAIFAMSFICFRKIATSFTAVDECEGELTTVIQENLSGIRVVRAFARQEYEISKFSAGNRGYREARLKLIRQLAWVWGGLDLLYFAQQGLTLGAGAWWVATGRLSLGDMYAAWAVVRLILMPMRQMGRVLADLGKAEVALGRIDNVLQSQPESVEGRTLPKRSGGGLVVSGLTYGYEANRPVIQDLSFEIKPGQVLGILGPTGAGKSTLVQLLLRMDEPWSGRIALDGFDLSQLSRQAAREQFATVLQEPFLFSKAIGASIAHSRPGATEAEIEEVARCAAIHEAITAFPQGYATEIGEKGVSLSGGQQQRVALARALLRQAPVMVIDDGLSAVDARTERLILEGLAARKGQTTIIIAHRLATLRLADRVLVMEEGRRTQYGSHEQLLVEEGLYQRLWAVQEGQLSEGDESQKERRNG